MTLSTAAAYDLAMTLAADRPVVLPDSVETFDSLDPGTGQVLASHPVHNDQQVAAAVARAREAAQWWQEQGTAGPGPT